jgi:iron complex outermembrane recepter protein
MPRMLRAVVYATVPFIGFLGAQPAMAQSTQPAASSSNGLEEIVVTARRREERVQTVPIAITALSQTDIEQAHVQQLRDLYKVVPGFSVSLTSSDPNSLYSGQVRIRGLGGSVIYFADVPVSNTDYSNTTGLTHGLSPGFYFDVDSVEVDKGAQGTLFGRPSIGGLIAVQPKRPTNDLEGYIQTTFGDYADYENEFAVNIPVVSDKLLVRVSGQMQQRDGYTHDLQTGDYLDNRHYYAWRAGVTFRPTDDFENYLLYDGYWQDSNGTSDVLLKVNPNLILSKLGPTFQPLPPGVTTGCTATVTVGGPAFGPLGNLPGGCGSFRIGLEPGLAGALATQQALGVRAVAGRYSSGIGKDYFYGFTDIARWDINDDLTLKNIAAARVTKQLAVDEFTNTGLGILTIGWPSTDGGKTPGNNNGWNDNSIQYTEELQLQGKSLEDKLSWILGGFLLLDKPLGYNTLPSTAVNATSWSHFREFDRSQAVFAHGIYDLSDWVPNLRFTAGYRFTWDYDSLGEVSTKPVNMVTRNAAGIATDCNIAGSDNNCFKQVDSSFNSYGWNLGLDYQWTPTTLVYIRSGNAYRPGGTNLAVPAPYNQYKPEHVTDVELGVKTDYDLGEDVHARTNADVFYTFYKAIQVSEVVTTPSPVQGQPPSAQQVTANAASANMQGVELEQQFSLPYGFELEAHGAYFNGSYNKYPVQFGGGAPGFQYIPRFSFGVTPTYHLPVDESVGHISASITWTWYGHQSVSPILDEPINYMPHYQSFDLRADWTDMFGQPIDLGFFMTNMTDNVHITGVIPLMTSLGFTSAAYNPPRMFGFSLKYRFSEAAEPEAPPAAYVPPPVQAPAAPKSYLVFFDFNKSDLTPQAVDIVNTAAKNASAGKVTQLTVTGHTDTVGSDAYNMRLSRRRAESVATQLEKDGIAASEIEIVAKGKRDLLVPTGDGVREPQNRRVQIVFDGGPTS